MSLRIVRSSVAVRDVGQIWSSIARDNIAAADRMLRAIDQTVRNLAETPELGIAVDELRPGLKCKPVRRRYLIFYVATKRELQVLRILHGARDFGRLFTDG